MPSLINVRERDRLSLFTYNNNEARYLSSYSWGSTERSLNKHIFEATLCPRLKEFQNGVNIWVGGMGLGGWVALDDTLECKSWRSLTAFAVITGFNFFLHTTLGEFVTFQSIISRSADYLSNQLIMPNWAGLRCCCFVGWSWTVPVLVAINVLREVELNPAVMNRVVQDVQDVQDVQHVLCEVELNPAVMNCVVQDRCVLRGCRRVLRSAGKKRGFDILRASATIIVIIVTIITTITTAISTTIAMYKKQHLYCGSGGSVNWTWFDDVNCIVGVAPTWWSWRWWW